MDKRLELKDKASFNKTEHNLCKVFTLIVLLTFITNISAPISDITSIDTNSVSNLCKIVIAGSIVIYIKSLIQKTNANFIIFVLFLSITFFFNILVFGLDNELFIQTLFRFYTMTVPVVWVALCIDDYDKLFSMMRKASYFIVLISVLLLLLTGINRDSYWMGLGYAMLLPELVLVNYFFKERKALPLLFSIIGIIPIIVFASRGPLVCIGLYFFISYLNTIMKAGRINIKSVFLLFITSVFFCIFIVKWNSIVQGAITALSFFGIKSRTLTLLSSSVFESSGRDVLTQRVLSKALEHPFAVRGINADYIILGQYTHNIFIEVFYEFGIAVALLMMILLLSLVIRTLKKQNNGSRNEFNVIVMCSSLPVLFFSGTVWQDTYFWVWIMISLVDKKKITFKRRK